MVDWIATLGDAIYYIAEPFMDCSRPRRLVAVVFAALTTFAILGTIIALALGAVLDPLGYFCLIPALLLTSSISCYCFITDRSQ